jgi:hypothetical protein
MWASWQQDSKQTTDRQQGSDAGRIKQTRQAQAAVIMNDKQQATEQAGGRQAEQPNRGEGGPTLYQPGNANRWDKIIKEIGHQTKKS